MSSPDSNLGTDFFLPNDGEGEAVSRQAALAGFKHQDRAANVFGAPSQHDFLPQADLVDGLLAKGSGNSLQTQFSLPSPKSLNIRYLISRGNQAKYFADNFDNPEVKKCAILQLELMRELSTLTESHKSLERTLKILKARHRVPIEEMVFDEAQEMQPRIFEEGMLYREKLIEFNRTTDLLDEAISTEIQSRDSFNLSRALQWRREAQQTILQTQRGFALLNEAEQKNQEVALFVAEYENALASSDLRYCLRLEAHPIYGLYVDGFKNIEARFEVAKQNGEIIRAKKLQDDPAYFASLHRAFPGFSREDFEYIFSEYGAYSEAALDALRDIFLFAENLRANELEQPANDLLDLHLKFSKVDGSPLGLPSQRINFYRKMLTLSALEYEWYSRRPSFDQGGPVLKDFTGKFISDRLIPHLLRDSDFSVNQFGLELHRWLTKGSSAQFDVLLDREYGVDISGVYRTNKVRLEAYIPPPPEKVAELMNLFDSKIHELITELNRRKTLLSPSSYEDAVIQIALYIQQIYVDIHPMRDGNGRVSRSLAEMFIRKFLSDSSPYASIPVSRDSAGEARVHADLVPFNLRWQIANQVSQLDPVAFDSVLRDVTLDDVLQNQLLTDYRIVFKRLIHKH